MIANVRLITISDKSAFTHILVKIEKQAVWQIFFFFYPCGFR